jgi:hypothetical protein
METTGYDIAGRISLFLRGNKSIPVPLDAPSSLMHGVSASMHSASFPHPVTEFPSYFIFS